MIKRIRERKNDTINDPIWNGWYKRMRLENYWVNSIDIQENTERNDTEKGARNEGLMVIAYRK